MSLQNNSLITYDYPVNRIKSASYLSPGKGLILFTFDLVLILFYNVFKNKYLIFF